MKLGIGKKLLIYFLALSLAPIIIGGTISFKITKNQLQENTKAHLSDLARDCGRKISFYVSSRYQDIRLLAQADVFEGNDLDAMQKYIEEAIEVYPFYDAISAIDLNGTITACSRKELIGESRAGRVWFQSTIQGNPHDVIPLDAYRAETAVWKIVIGFNSPVTDESNNKIIRVLTTRVSVDHIIERVQALDKRIGGDNHAYLLNNTGEILAGPEEKEFLTTHRLYDFPVIKDLLSGKTGITEYKNDRGKDVISAGYALKGDGDFNGWGWGIIVTQSVSEAFKAAYLIRNTMIVMASGIIFFVTMISIFISKSFSRPITEVSESALRISAGDLKPIKIKYGAKDEIGDLVGAFNKMTQDLHATTVSRDSLAKEVTERKRAEEALRESEEKFRILSEQSLLGIIIIQDGLIKYANEAFSKIVGCSVEEIQGWKSDIFLKIVYPDNQSSLIEQAQKGQISDKDLSDHYQVRIVTKNGEVKWIDIYSKTIIYNGRKAAMATLIDITEKKVAEEKVKIQQQQLIQADKLASLGILVAGVAHEINNPNQFIMLTAPRLSGVWQSVKPILDECYKKNGDFLVGGMSYSKNKDKISNYLSRILDGAKQIDRIVNDLKKFARYDQDNHMAEIDINVVVKSALTLVSNMIKKSTQNFDLDLGQHLPNIKGNSQRLEQVVMNLIQNSCQSLPDKKKGIFIKTAYDKEKQQVRTEVRDEGTGIKPEDLARITDPFFTTKRSLGGTGLGLSVSSAIIEDHRGTMHFSSEPEAGTTATITLPAEE